MEIQNSVGVLNILLYHICESEIIKAINNSGLKKLTGSRFRVLGFSSPRPKIRKITKFEKKNKIFIGTCQIDHG